MNLDLELDRKRLRELALRAQYAKGACFTHFLEPSSETWASAAARECGVSLCFFGGWADAERRMAAFYQEDAPIDEAYPIAALEMRWNEKFASPGHRDLLGAVMGLGLERDAIGDIALSEMPGCAYLFVHRDVESYVCANLESAGRASLTLRAATLPIRVQAPEGTETRVTISAERLDAILAAGLKLSRAEAQRLVDAGLVKLNHVEERRADQRLKPNDLISVRGYGRLRLIELEGVTRKGRLAARIFRYRG